MIDIFEKYKAFYSDTIPRPQPCDFVETYFADKSGLFFVDVGAHNGITWSNTLPLEENYNWSGICIEPNPKVFKELANNRHCRCLNIGMSDTDDMLEFCKIDGYSEMLSGFTKFYHENHKRRIEVETSTHGNKVEFIDIPTKKLSDVLRAEGIRDVDYLSVDVESAELLVLKGIDFDAVTIKLISCEDNYGCSDVEQLLSQNRFKRLKKVCGDVFYERVEV